MSPVPIEGKLAGNPLIDQVCVMGSGLRAPVAVVVPAPATQDMPQDALKESLEATLHEVNGSLESHEKLSTIFVVDDPWTIENGLLTPTLKIKRDKLESLYEGMIREDTRGVVWRNKAG